MTEAVSVCSSSDSKLESFRSFEVFGLYFECGHCSPILHVCSLVQRTQQMAHKVSVYNKAITGISAFVEQLLSFKFKNIKFSFEQVAVYNFGTVSDVAILMLKSKPLTYWDSFICLSEYE